MEFQLSNLEKVVEIMKDVIKQELDAFKDDIHAIMGGTLNYLSVLHILNSSTKEEGKEKKNVESWSHIGKIEAKLEKRRFESLTYGLS